VFKSKSDFMLPLFVGISYLFLYLPIVILILYSFNSGALEYTWSDFTTQWYKDLLSSQEAWDALKTSLIVGVSTVIITIVMSALLVFFGERTFLSSLFFTFYANLAIPEIVLAVGLLSLFYFFSIPLSTTTLIVGHTIIGLGYAVPMIHTRFKEIDTRIIEASYDLGATPFQTFFKIILPLMSPALIASAMLVFIISFDDFIISFFCSSGSTQTLPIYIFSMIRSGASPEVSALSTILLVVSAFLVLIFSSLQNRSWKGNQ
jgi:spermidine/putrescine transport system permease protein